MELPLSSCERTSLLQEEPFAPVETEQRPMVYGDGIWGQTGRTPVVFRQFGNESMPFLR
jgi:hypothetical protein